MKKLMYILMGLLLLGGIAFVFMAPSKPGKYDDLAKCLKDKGFTFYGAFWCPHCQAQKARFGASAKLLPYIECSTADGQGQLPVCKAVGITTYPTWQFSASTTDRYTGEMELKELAEKSSCVLPQ